MANIATNILKGKPGKKRIIVIIMIAAIAAAAVFGYFRLQASASQQGAGSVPDTVLLSKTNLESKVTASGNLASTDPVTVGSNVEMGEVETVYVSAGDQVYAGDVLAKLKTSDIERSISDTSSAISDAAASDTRNLTSAQRAFDEANTSYYANLDANTKAVENAKAALQAANSALDAANKTRETAAADLAAAPSDLNTTDPDAYKKLEEADAAAKQAATAAQQAEAAAAEAVTKAEQQLESQTRSDNSAWYKAKDQLDTAQSQDSTEKDRTSLESLNEDLSNASIVSPITGIVTKVNTENGKASSGDMFTIEDTASLGITANVAEYDVINIEEGMKAYITSNATDEQVFEGTVDYVSPVAADTSGNFEVEVTLTGDIGALRPGMTATVEIVIASKEDIFAVPIDAIVTNPDGSKVVYAYEGGEMPTFGGSGEMPDMGSGEMPDFGSGEMPAFDRSDATQMTEGERIEIEVETGMETDYYIEISGEGLEEGMLILSDPEGRSVQSDTGMDSFNIGGGMGGGMVMTSGGPPAGGARPN